MYLRHQTYTLYYRDVCILVFLHVFAYSCYCDACLNSSDLRVGVTTLLNTIHIQSNFQQLNSILSKSLDLEWPSTTLYEKISLEILRFYINDFNSIVDLGYTHQPVNHSVEYVRADGVRPNDTESLWCDAKRKFKAMNGCSQRSNIPSYLDEWMWKRKFWWLRTLWRVRGRNWTQSLYKVKWPVEKQTKKNNNACLMKCENCFFAFANHRHDNGKF